MSLSLLKQSLEILEQDSTTTTAAKGVKSKQTVHRNATAARENSKQSGLKSKQIKKVSDIKQEMNMNTQKSKENLKKLLALSKNTLKDTDAEKIFKRAHKGRYVKVDLNKSEKEIETPFTDEDFRAFEEEYFKS